MGDNFSQSFLAERQNALQGWLEAAITQTKPSVFDLPPFVEFLTVHANSLPGALAGKPLGLPANALHGSDQQSTYSTHATSASVSGEESDGHATEQQQAGGAPTVSTGGHPPIVGQGDKSLGVMSGSPDGIFGPASTTATPVSRRRVTIDDFELLKVVGKGSFGKVLLVRKKDTGQVFAMKMLSKPNVVKRRQVHHTITERKVLSYTRHPFIVTLHYAFQSPTQLYFVLDYCGGGELFFHLGKAGRFKESVARFYAAELVLALGHLHRRGVVYRDLKPENILLDTDGHVKLADFGLSKEGINSASEGTKSFCGTPEYLAPEILDRKGHGFACDWWSLGMLIYEMLTGLPPWYTRDRKKLYSRLRSAPLEFPAYISPNARELLSGLLTRDPAARLGSERDAHEIVTQPFFEGLDWYQLRKRKVLPPFVPRLKLGETDTRYFDDEFTSLPADLDMADKDNVQDKRPAEERQHSAGSMFRGFTYDAASDSVLAAPPHMAHSFTVGSPSDQGFLHGAGGAYDLSSTSTPASPTHEPVILSSSAAAGRQGSNGSRHARQIQPGGGGIAMGLGRSAQVLGLAAPSRTPERPKSLKDGDGAPIHMRSSSGGVAAQAPAAAPPKTKRLSGRRGSMDMIRAHQGAMQGHFDMNSCDLDASGEDSLVFVGGRAAAQPSPAASAFAASDAPPRGQPVARM